MLFPAHALFDWCTRLNINSYRKRLATLCSSSVLTCVCVCISLSISQNPLFYAAPLCLILMASLNEPIRTLNARALNRHTKPNLHGHTILALIKEAWQELILLLTCSKLSCTHFTRPLVPIWVKWSVFWGRDTMFGQEVGGGLKACGQDGSDRGAEVGGGGGGDVEGLK